jgi:hypothetical protein
LTAFLVTQELLGYFLRYQFQISPVGIPDIPPEVSPCVLLNALLVYHHQQNIHVP